MSHKIVTGSLLTIIVLMICVTFFFCTHNTADTSSHNPSGYDAFVDELHQIQFNKLGLLSNVFMTPNIKHFSQDAHSLIQHPHIILHNDKGMWDITADTATTNGDNTEVHLIGHVVMSQSATPTTASTVIKTNYATIFPKRSYAMTKEYVTITRGNTLISGIGATADMKQGIVKLLSHTRGHYAPEEKKP